MSQYFIQGLAELENETTTENGSFAYKSTKSKLLDLFASCGALRNKSEAEITAKFYQAYAENPLLATRMAFYTRNVRGGLGERSTSRIMLRALAIEHPEVMSNNLRHIASFGRWDDYFCLIGTKLQDEMFSLLKAQLLADFDNAATNNGCSLLAKWLKTQNASSAESRSICKLTYKAFGMTKKEYQKITSFIRKYLSIPEVLMSCKRWEEIEYSRVPSRCMMINKNAFKTHSAERFGEYLGRVKEGKEKINASTLFPYDIFRDMELNTRGAVASFNKPNDVSEEQWKALPDYLNGRNVNALVMADTSYSMVSNEKLPILTALSLAVYFAERNTGEFHNCMMTFSSKPSFIRLSDGSLNSKIGAIPMIVENTNISAALDMILKTGVRNSLSTEDMPKSLIIISDMQFDAGCDGYGETVYKYSLKKFEAAGYNMPSIIFWNVADKQAAYQVFGDTPGVQLVSGSSTAIFKQLFDNVGRTPYEAMENILNGEDYSMITLSSPVEV